MVKITPLLQSLLMKQQDTILALMNANRYVEAWDCIKNGFASVLPQPVFHDVERDLVRVQSRIDVYRNDHQLDLTQERVTQNQRIRSLCRLVVPQLLRKINDGLYEKGYFEWGRKEEATMA